MVWRWGVSGAPLTVEADSLLWTLNELLRDSAILIQPLCLPDAAVRYPPAAQDFPTWRITKCTWDSD